RDPRPSVGAVLEPDAPAGDRLLDRARCPARLRAIPDRALVSVETIGGQRARLSLSAAKREARLPARKSEGYHGARPAHRCELPSTVCLVIGRASRPGNARGVDHRRIELRRPGRLRGIMVWASLLAHGHRVAPDRGTQATRTTADGAKLISRHG